MAGRRRVGRTERPWWDSRPPRRSVPLVDARLPGCSGGDPAAGRGEGRRGGRDRVSGGGQGGEFPVEECFGLGGRTAETSGVDGAHERVGEHVLADGGPGLRGGVALDGVEHPTQEQFAEAVLLVVVVAAEGLGADEQVDGLDHVTESRGLDAAVAERLNGAGGEEPGYGAGVDDLLDLVVEGDAVLAGSLCQDGLADDQVAGRWRWAWRAKEAVEGAGSPRRSTTMAGDRPSSSQMSMSPRWRWVHDPHRGSMTIW